MKKGEIKHFVYQCAREMRKNPTPAEDAFWEEVRDRRLLGLKFNRQFVIQYEEVLGKPSFFIADFHCFEARLIIEIDGEIHQMQEKWDAIRDEILEQLGYKVIRIKNEDVLHGMEEVKSFLRCFLELTP